MSALIPADGQENRYTLPVLRAGSRRLLLLPEDSTGTCWEAVGGVVDWPGVEVGVAFGSPFPGCCSWVLLVGGVLAAL